MKGDINMNKFLNRFSTALISLSLAVGIGVSLNSEKGVIRAEAAAESYNTTFSYNDKNLTLTDYEDKSSYYLVPSLGTESVATFADVFEGKSLSSDVMITINHATYGKGTNPSETTFSFYSDSACTNAITATQSGTLASSSSYANVIYTITKDKIAF